VSHANATLTPITRLRLACLSSRPAGPKRPRPRCSWSPRGPAKKWADRYRMEGPSGMADPTSRPHHCPSKTPTRVARRIVALRWRHRLGPVQIAGRLGTDRRPPPCSGARGCRINRLTRIACGRLATSFTRGVGAPTPRHRKCRSRRGRFATPRGVVARLDTRVLPRVGHLLAVVSWRSGFGCLLQQLKAVFAPLLGDRVRVKSHPGKPPVLVSGRCTPLAVVSRSCLPVG
jgi:hypothetical protein